MRHSESSPDLNSISIAIFLPSSPLSGGICYIGVIFNNFNVSLSFCFGGMGDYSSFPSVIRNICFNLVDRGSVVFMHFVVMYFVM